MVSAKLALHTAVSKLIDSRLSFWNIPYYVSDALSESKRFNEICQFKK